MKDFYNIAYNFFGKDWIIKEYELFISKRKKYLKASNNSEIDNIEESLHPLIKEIARIQKNEDELNLFDIPKNSIADFYLSHIGRDIQLLEKELQERGKHIKHDLLQPQTFENHRFNLLVAAGYKLLNYKVQFIPPKNKEKQPDLLITNNQNSLYIESKQRDQKQGDRERHKFHARLYDSFFKILSVKNIKGVCCSLHIKGEIKKYEQTLNLEISKRLWRNNLNNFNIGKNIQVEFTNTISEFEMLKILKVNGHFIDRIKTTTSLNNIITSDYKNNNILIIYKGVNASFIPKKIYELFDDANSKVKSDHKLLFHFDIGRGYPEWADKLKDEILNGLSNNNNPYPNIDCYIITQSMLKMKSIGESFLYPNPYIIASKKQLGFEINENNIFGLQGKTGFDKYWLPEFMDK